MPKQATQIRTSAPTPKRLVFRLSSLGDVILSTSFLSALDSSDPSVKVDWVVAREFAEVLRGHPRIRKLWEFDRSQGLKGWLSLCDELVAEKYDQVFDLHATLRTRVAWFYFLLKGQFSTVRSWKRISKERVRLTGLYLFKNAWPRSWGPSLFVERYSRIFAGSPSARPDLRHLLSHGNKPEMITSEGSPVAPGYYCVMPGSKWASKRWAPEKFLAVVRRSQGTPVILGGPKDTESFELMKMLQGASIAYIDGVGKWSLPQVAQVLSGARAYLGNDTGIAHLAEAVGTPSLIIFGPTSPRMGFSPWRAESGSAGVSLGCRPCGKDGRRCYRPKRKYLCMTALEAETVARQLRNILERTS